MERAPLRRSPLHDRTVVRRCCIDNPPHPNHPGGPMNVPRKGTIAGSTLLLAAVLAGCSDQVVSPVTRAPGARSSVKAPLTPLITTSTLWDFANIGNKGANGPFDLGTSHTFSISGSGS